MLDGAYFGGRGPLFSLALGAAILSVLTLGLYRFWERTRIRRYIWNSTAPESDPFEYTGTGIEKFLGFLVALVVLAVLLSVLQFSLFFLGITLIKEPSDEESFSFGLILAQSSFLIMVPLSFFAGYRARRYKLARTRWRGIRFGLDAGALGYAWRGVLYLLLTICSAGLLWPLMTFRLEKYRADRTWFGDARLHQGGSWGMLYKSFKHLFIAALVGGGATIAGFATQAPGLAIFGGIFAVVWFFVGLLYYRVDSFRRLAATKTLGENITFTSDLRTRRVARHLAFGWLLTAFVAGLVLSVYGGFIAGLGLAEFGEGLTLQGVSLPQVAVSLIGLLVVLAVYGTLSLIFITQPIIEEVVSTTRVLAPAGLGAIQQRARDSFADADGFADALDMGGAF